ncbi:hypothetical protein P7C70_g3690, partial [Phenoliferia sp. Uapishka_3]
MNHSSQRNALSSDSGESEQVRGGEDPDEIYAHSASSSSTDDLLSIADSPPFHAPSTDAVAPLEAEINSLKASSENVVESNQCQLQRNDEHEKQLKRLTSSLLAAEAATKNAEACPQEIMEHHQSKIDKNNQQKAVIKGLESPLVKATKAPPPGTLESKITKLEADLKTSAKALHSKADQNSRQKEVIKGLESCLLAAKAPTISKAAKATLATLESKIAKLEADLETSVKDHQSKADQNARQKGTLKTLESSLFAASARWSKSGSPLTISSLNSSREPRNVSSL